MTPNTPSAMKNIATIMGRWIENRVSHINEDRLPGHAQLRELGNRCFTTS